MGELKRLFDLGAEEAPSQREEPATKPAPEPASEQLELPPRWGRDLGALDREANRGLVVLEQRGAIRNPAPSEVLGPRFLVRSGLFSRGDPAQLATGEVKQVPNGWSLLRGAALTWWDLRALLLLINQALADAQGRTRISMPPTRLLRMIGQQPNSRSMERARFSLERLTSTRVAFELSPGGAVGSTAEPERFLDEEGSHVYGLREWLAASARRAGGGGEPRMPWALLCRLQQGAFLTYLFLESEDWRKARPGRDPIDPSVEELASVLGPIILAEPMLAMLDLNGLSSRKSQMTAVQRSLRQILGRDLRYRGFRLVSRGPSAPPQLYVWRQTTPLSPQHLYLGPLCRRCVRPDPKRECCCKRPEEMRCKRDQCPRCAEISRT